MRILSCLMIVLTVCRTAAAHDDCATVVTPEQAASLRQRIAAGTYPPVVVEDGPGGVITVPLTFHVCRRSDGTGGIPLERLDQALIDANDGYAPIDIQYCVPGPVLFIDDDRYNPLTSTGNANALRQIQVVPGTINIYFTETSLFCGLSSFTFSSVQGIVMNNACTGLPTNRSTFPHEIGHYFDLFHTHESSMGRECTSGSNCATAGDLVCDTPADPNVLNQVNAACQWTGSGNGPCAGDPPYDPDVTNFMSYSSKPCRDNFTPQQLTRARDTLVTLRTELNVQLCPTPPRPGDLNCDGAVNVLDIGPFALALTDPAGYAAAFPTCNIQLADMNADHQVRGDDVDGFVRAVLGP